MKREHLLKIGVSGIRGVVGEFLTPGLALAFGQAFGTYVGRGRVVVGRDTRRTGEMLQHAVHCGLLAAGCEVVDVGVLPTPTIQMYVEATKARGGIALTASHNPPEYNALKLFNAEGLFFNSYERSELIDLYHQSAFYSAANDEIRSVHTEHDAPKRLHIERVLKHVDVERIRERRFRVALDGVNGAGSVMTPGFLTRHSRAANCTPSPSTRPSRSRARPSRGPIPSANWRPWSRAAKCEIGFAQDPDGDRLAVCDENGRMLDNDDVLALAVDAALERRPGRCGGEPHHLLGHRRRRGAPRPPGVPDAGRRSERGRDDAGREGGHRRRGLERRHHLSGRASLPRQLHRDGLPARTGWRRRARRSPQLAAKLPTYYRKLGKVAFEHGMLGPLMQALEEKFPDVPTDRSDGLKLMWPGKWIHVRASNTEPLLRLAAEAKTEAEMDDLYSTVTELLGRG